MNDAPNVEIAGLLALVILPAVRLVAGDRRGGKANRSRAKPSGKGFLEVVRGNAVENELCLAIGVRDNGETKGSNSSKDLSLRGTERSAECHDIPKNRYDLETFSPGD